MTQLSNEQWPRGPDDGVINQRSAFRTGVPRTKSIRNKSAPFFATVMIPQTASNNLSVKRPGPEVIFRKSIREMTNDRTHILEARDLCLAAEKGNQMSEEINMDNERSAVTSCEGDKQAIPVSSLTSKNLSAALALAEAGCEFFRRSQFVIGRQEDGQNGPPL